MKKTMNSVMNIIMQVIFLACTAIFTLYFIISIRLLVSGRMLQSITRDSVVKAMFLATIFLYIWLFIEIKTIFNHKLKMSNKFYYYLGLISTIELLFSCVVIGVYMPNSIFVNNVPFNSSMKYVNAIVDGVAAFISKLPWMKENAGLGLDLDSGDFFLTIIGIALGMIVILIELLVLAIICVIPAIIGIVLAIPFMLYLSQIKKGTIISVIFVLYYLICPGFIYNMSTVKGLVGFIITTLVIAFGIHHVASLFRSSDKNAYRNKAEKVEKVVPVKRTDSPALESKSSSSSDWDDIGEMDENDIWAEPNSPTALQYSKQAERKKNKRTSKKNKESRFSKTVKKYKESKKPKDVYGPHPVVNIVYTIIVVILVGISAYVWNVHSIGEFNAHKSTPNYMSIIDALKDGTPPIALFYAIFGGIFTSRHVAYVERWFKSSNKIWVVIGKIRSFLLNFLGFVWAAPIVSNTFYAIRSLDYDKGVDTNLLTVPLNILHDPFWNEHFILNVIVTATLMVVMFILLLFFYVYAFTYFPNFLVMIVCCVFISRLSIMPGLSLLPIAAMSAAFNFTSDHLCIPYDYVLIDILGLSDLDE